MNDNILKNPPFNEMIRVILKKQKATDAITKLKSIRLKTNLVETIEEMAKKENRNFSNMVETMLLKYFEK